MKLRLVQQKRWDAAEAYYAKLVEKKTRAESSRSAAAVAWEAGAEDEISAESGDYAAQFQAKLFAA